MRRDEQYEQAKDKVKISYFTERGHDITGLIHVGANDGYEVQWYRQMGIAPVLCFEPLPRAIEAFRSKYGDDLSVTLREIALGDVPQSCAALMAAPGDGQGSTFLREFSPHVAGVAYCLIARFDSLGIDVSPYNCLVVDVQGMELQVLKGFGEQLKHFKFLNIECSREPLYEGEAPAAEVIAFLAKQGFVRQTPIEDHNDIMFLREDCVPVEPRLANLRLNCGSGQRPFAKPWLNIDAQARWNPDLVADCWNLPYEAESCEMIVYHHCWEHEGCGEARRFQRESFRLLQKGGSLLVFVPDMRALAQAWLMGKLDTETYLIDVYGAYMGDEHDRHKFGYTRETLLEELKHCPWQEVKLFDWRRIPGADIARDFWILAVEAVK